MKYYAPKQSPNPTTQRFIFATGIESSYSLVDHVDWDTALRENNGRINPLGLFDLDRKICRVGRASKKLIEQWSFQPLLPNGPLTLFGEWEADWQSPPEQSGEAKEDTA